jgi:hypothetical protein
MSACLSIRPSACLSVCLSVHLHITTRFPLDEFSCNFFLEVFENLSKTLQNLLKADKDNGYFT